MIPTRDGNLEVFRKQWRGKERHFRYIKKFAMKICFLLQWSFHPACLAMAEACNAPNTAVNFLFCYISNRTGKSDSPMILYAQDLRKVMESKL